MRSRSTVILLVGGWLLALAGLAWCVAQRLVVSSDLRSFMPPAQTADQRLLLDEIGEGPASRLLMLAIFDIAPEHSTALSHALTRSLANDARFTRVLNGEGDLSALDPKLLPYRYLLSPTLDTERFDAAFLRSELQERVEDLGSPAADLIKPLLPRDPTLEVLKLAQRWTPTRTPPQRDGVWFAPDIGALLLVQTQAGGFDPSAQADAIQALQAAFAALPGVGNARLEISGPGYIGVQVSTSTRAQAEWLGAISSAGFILLMLFAYRNLTVVALAALPLLSGAVVGIAATALVFGPIHGITLAFGFTLLGVAQEYPIRLLSHRRADETAFASMRGVWPLLRVAIVSACIAYLAFFASGVIGLEQLAVFTISGLLVAGAATRWLLPAVLPQRFRDVADSALLDRAVRWLDRLRRPRVLPWLLLVAGMMAMLLAPTPFWQNDLAALTPVPLDLLKREGQLRDALAAPDVRYLLVMEGATPDQTLVTSESISAQVDKWISQHAVGDVELPSRYLPSMATQRERQSKLPTPESLKSALDEALRDSPFQADLFAPFLDDVVVARALPPLTPELFGESLLGARFKAMLSEREGHWLALATLTDVRNPESIATIDAQTQGKVHLLDLKTASESLVAAYRVRIAQALVMALLLLAATVAIAFRDARRAWHVIAPMSLATLLVLAVLRVSGVSLSLFHLVALTLAAGLGLHYALFFERPVADAAEARRTLHATIVCVVSALLVFGLLGCSSIPVLRAIGVTVSLGVAFHFCLSILMARERKRQ